MQKAILFPALRVAGTYMVAGALWIIFSDKLLLMMVPDPKALTSIQIYKGWGFVLASGLLIYHLLRRELIRIVSAEEGLAIAIDAAQLGNWDLDLLQKKSQRSLRHDEIFGYNSLQTDWNYEILLSHVVPEDRDKVADCFDRALVDGVLHVDCRILWADQTTHWIELRGRTHFDSGGRPIRMRGVVSDITQRKETEAAVLSSEQTLKTILAASPVGIGLSVDRRMKWVNDAWAEMFGFQNPSDSMDQPARIVYESDQEYDRAGALLYRNLQRGLINEVDTRLKRKDGSSFDACIRMTALDPDDLSAGQLAVITDITGRKQAEESIRRSEQRYHSLFDNMLEGLAHCQILFRDGKPYDFEYLDVNESFERLTGLKNAVGKKVTELIPSFKESNPEVFDTYGRVALSGNPERFEAYVDALGIWFSVSAYSTEKGQFVAVFDNITERKQASAALRTSEAKLSSALEMAHLGHWEYDVPNDLFSFNDQFYKLFRTTAEQVGRYTMTSSEYAQRFLHPDDVHMVRDEIQNMLESTDSQLERQLEHRFMYADGEVGYISVRFFIVRDSAGRIIRTYGVNQDITQRKRAEEALKESEARVRTKLDSILLPEGDIGNLELSDVLDTTTIQSLMDDFYALTQIGIGIVDLKGNILAGTGWQEICTKFHRHHPETCRHCVESDTFLSAGVEKGSFKVYKCKNNMWDIVTPIIVGGKHLGNLFLGQFLFEDEAPDYEAFRSQARQYGFDEHQYIAALEKVPRWSSQTVHTVMTFYIKFADMLSTLSYSNIKLARSLAEQERAEEDRVRLVTAIEQAVETVVMTDDQGTILYVNPAFERTTGYSSEEALGLNTRILKSGQHDSSFYKSLWKTISSGAVWSGHFVNRKKDGTLFEEEATISPVKDDSGKIVNYVAVKRDVTREVSLQKQLLQAQKMEAVGTLAGGIAHDFNNLLQVTLGFSELLLQDKREDDPEHADLQKIFHAAKNGAELVQRLLTFSRKVEPKLVVLNLNRQIMQIDKLLRRTIPKMIAIRLDLASDLAEIHADSTQMEQILMNLAVNARDAMPDGGSLTISTTNTTLDEDYCSFHSEAVPGEYVLLTVSDTGHGMTRETIEHVFEPFYTTKELGRGTGLGLAMVYGIVSQHGGHISCYSEVGRGTTFNIYLPAIPSEAEPDIESSGEMPAFGTETVLLVDDEELVRELGERILSKHGYGVLTASNGLEALDIYRRHKEIIALTILDLVMPAMGGKDCLKALKDVDPEAKVLIASGYSGDASIREVLGLGAIGFVGKPFRFKDLLRQVRGALDKN